MDSFIIPSGEGIHYSEMRRSSNQRVFRKVLKAFLKAKERTVQPEPLPALRQGGWIVLLGSGLAMRVLTRVLAFHVPRIEAGDVERDRDSADDGEDSLDHDGFSLTGRDAEFFGQFVIKLK